MKVRKVGVRSLVLPDATEGEGAALAGEAASGGPPHPVDDGPGRRGGHRASHVLMLAWIFGGTSEIMKTIIAREVTGLRA